MRLSHNKITHLSTIIAEGLKKEGVLSPIREEEARREIRAALEEFLRVDDDIDQVVRKKIDTLEKKPPEGSQEWQVLYKKYFRQEEVRRGR